MLATIYYFNHKCAVVVFSLCKFVRVSLNGIIVGVPSAVKSIHTHDLNRREVIKKKKTKSTYHKLQRVKDIERSTLTIAYFCRIRMYL